MKNGYTSPLQPIWDSAAQAEWDDICNALLSDPCLQRFNFWKPIYVLTDFCKDGFGYAACQPGDDEPSLAAMPREMHGSECEFLKPSNKFLLHPVAFGFRLPLHPRR